MNSSSLFQNDTCSHSCHRSRWKTVVQVIFIILHIISMVVFFIIFEIDATYMALFQCHFRWHIFCLFHVDKTYWHCLQVSKAPYLHPDLRSRVIIKVVCSCQLFHKPSGKTCLLSSSASWCCVIGNLHHG